MTFKDIILDDIRHTFFNPQEHAEEKHMVDGKPMTVIFDDIENVEREKRMKSHMDGIFARQKLVYFMEDEFGPLPAQGRMINLDGKLYTVVDATDEDGAYAVTLEANRSK